MIGRAGRDRTRPVSVSWRASGGILALAVLLAACGSGRSSPAADSASPGAPGGVRSGNAAAARVPRLVDVGAGKCIPCKAMAPILAQLRTEFAGRLNVEFIDVWVNPDAGQPYGIRLIPTQIFFGPDGRELSRHEGFMSREEILARWKFHGIAF